MDRHDDTATPAEILVCDDMASNVQLLGRLLRAEGYQVRVALGGEAALAAVQRRVPDLVLLDIVMPDVSGYEVCRRLHALPGAEGVPVIFISGLADSSDKVLAFTSGGVDYITKPFEAEEVRARVANHLRIAALKNRLELRNQELMRAQEEQRALQRMQESLTSLVVHDMRSPLMGILASLELLGMDKETLAPDARDDLESATLSAQALTGLVNDLLSVTKLEAAEMPLELGPHVVQQIWTEAHASLGGLAKGRHLELEGDTNLTCVCDASLIRRTLVNLTDNALKHTPKGCLVRVRVAQEGANLRVEVIDSGRGIAEEHWDRIFEKFGQVALRSESVRASTGLGLTFCKLAVEAHGGRIGLHSKLGAGSTFWFEIPMESATQEPG